jgi:general secretion pathway protein A
MAEPNEPIPTASSCADWFQLVTDPFADAPHVKFLPVSQSQQEALACIKESILTRRRLTVILGESGTGKTAVIRSYIETAQGTEQKIIYVSQALELTVDDLLVTMLKELGAEPVNSEPAAMQRQLKKRLRAKFGRDRRAVLVIDNAALLTDETVQAVCGLFETLTEKLLQIVLVGRCELEATLNRHIPNIPARATVTPLSRNESIAYIAEHLAAAGGSHAIFSPEAQQIIIDAAGGLPSHLNMFCSKALSLAYRDQKRIISENLANEAVGRELVVSSNEQIHSAGRVPMLEDPPTKIPGPLRTGMKRPPSALTRHRAATVANSKIRTAVIVGVVLVIVGLIAYLSSDMNGVGKRVAIALPAADSSVAAITTDVLQNETMPRSTHIPSTDAAPSKEDVDSSSKGDLDSNTQDNVVAKTVAGGEFITAEKAEMRETARLLAVLLDCGRVVVGRAQPTINNPRLEDKGFSSSVFEGQLRKEFLTRTGYDIRNMAAAPMPEHAKLLVVRLAFFMQKAVQEVQPLINKKGIGFKGFIPATFGTTVADRFSRDTGVNLRQISPPGVAPRNPGNKPDAQEEQALRAVEKSHPRVGDHIVEQQLANHSVRVLLPLFYGKQCLGCHGKPKGEVDISGYPREGFKEGDLGGAISVTLHANSQTQ